MMIKLPDRYNDNVSHLSAGGMATILKCRDKNLDRDVIVKALKVGIEPRRLIDELNALSAIRSDHVAQVYDVIMNEGTPVAIVQQHVIGTPIKPFAKNIDPDKAISIIHQIAIGIDEIHKSNVIHRDLTPNNIIISEGGFVTIIDFGLSETTSTALTANLMGTKGYVAPECFTEKDNKNYEFTQSCDIYSFGAVCYFLLNNGTLDARLTRLPPANRDENLSVSNCLVRLPKTLCDIIDQCIKAAPESRPKATALRTAFARELLKNKKKLRIPYQTKCYIIDKNTPKLTIGTSSDNVTIEYDGYDFIVRKVVGAVKINNRPPSPGHLITGSSVVVVGSDIQPEARLSIHTEVSNPELMA